MKEICVLTWQGGQKLRTDAFALLRGQGRFSGRGCSSGGEREETEHINSEDVIDHFARKMINLRIESE